MPPGNRPPLLVTNNDPRARRDPTRESEVATPAVLAISIITVITTTIIRFVNNEIGVLQPIEAIGKICKKNKIFLHVDAAQAIATLISATYSSSRVP